MLLLLHVYVRCRQWSLAAAEEFRPSKVSGRKSTIIDQRNLLVAKIADQKDGPIGIALAGIPKWRLESHFGLLLKRERESNHKASVSSGGTSPQLEGQETELVRSDCTVEAWHFSWM